MNPTNRKKVFRPGTEATIKLTKTAQRKLTVTCIVLLGIALIVLWEILGHWKRQNAAESEAVSKKMQESFSAQVQEQLGEMKDCLDELDRGILENVGRLAAVSVSLETKDKALDEVLSLQQQMGTIHQGTQDMMEMVSGLVTELESARAGEMDRYAESLIEISRANEVLGEVDEFLTQVKSGLDESRKQLEILLQTLDGEGFGAEIKKQLAGVEESLGVLLNRNMLWMESAYDSLTEELEKQTLFLSGQVEDSFQELDRNLGESFTGLGENMDASFIGLGENMDASFTGLGENMDASFSGLGENMGASFTGLGENMDSGFSSLGQSMDEGFLGLEQGTGKRLTELEQRLAEKTERLKENMENSLNDLSENMESGMERLDSDIRNRFEQSETDISEELDMLHTDMAAEMEQLRADTSMALEQLGTDISAGMEQLGADMALQLAQQREELSAQLAELSAAEESRQEALMQVLEELKGLTLQLQQPKQENGE